MQLTLHDNDAVLYSRRRVPGADRERVSQDSCSSVSYRHALRVSPFVRRLSPRFAFVANDIKLSFDLS